MIRRFLRSVVAFTLAALAAPAWTQQPSSVPVVGFLMLSATPDESPAQGLRKGLHELGYVEGQNIRIEYRYARGNQELLLPLAHELADLKVSVIVTGADPIARVSLSVASSIPVVVVLFDNDPVASGLVASLSHPGGNVTGIFTLQPDLVAKRLELLKEALPKVSRVAVFWDSYSKRQLDALRSAGGSLGIELHPIELRAPYDFAAAFRAAKKRRAGAVVVLFSPVLWEGRSQLAKMALEYGLPTISQDESWVMSGGLISYGPPVVESFARAAYYVDRLLKGAKAGDLPIEQSTKFKLMVNLKTAKALGVTIPDSILLRADEVIK